MLDALRASGEAPVVVALALPADAESGDPARRREEIARLQHDVLARLGPDDFRVRELYASVPAMAGMVRSRTALEVLEAHPAVAKVDLDPAGGGSGAR